MATEMFCTSWCRASPLRWIREESSTAPRLGRESGSIKHSELRTDERERRLSLLTVEQLLPLPDLISGSECNASSHPQGTNCNLSRMNLACGAAVADAFGECKAACMTFVRMKSR